MQVNHRNTTAPVARTHEGARAHVVKPLDALKRTVLACLLFEKSFYEDGESAAARIKRLAHECAPGDVWQLAYAARLGYGLRSAPIWLTNALWSHPQRKALNGAPGLPELVDAVCQRPDDMGELIAMYWMDGKHALPAAMKRGLAGAFTKFSTYQLAKYAKRGNIRLRDVMRLVHPKPKDDAQSTIWKQLAADTLEAADTWEVALSAGADKNDTFTRLLVDGKLGALALLRNMRNMQQVGVDRNLVESELQRLAPRSKLLPFQFIAAARAVPQWEGILEAPMLQAAMQLDKLPGKTALLIDTSGSMGGPLSAKSTLNRLDGAKGLAILCREMCERVDVYKFDARAYTLPPRRGFALGDAIGHASGGTDIAAAVHYAMAQGPYDRYIIFTDEQSRSEILASPPDGAHGYIMNVANYEHGIGHGKWTTISGFSENVLRFIAESEQ